MDKNEELSPSSKGPNPMLAASFLSKIFFIFVRPIFKEAYKKKDLTTDDLFKVMPQDSTERQGTLLQREWELQLRRQKDGHKASLLKALVCAYGPIYAVYGIGGIIKEVLKITQPILLGLLVEYFAVDSETTTAEAYLYASLLSLNYLVFGVFHGPYYWCITRLGMNARVGLCSLVYKKILRLHGAVLNKIATGQVHVMMTNDVNRFDQLFIYLHYLWLGPAEALLILGLLYLHIGWACIPGYVIMFFLIPVQTVMGRLFLKLRHGFAKYTDKRITLMTEVITSMRVIKMYALEEVFSDLVKRVRESEVKKIISAAYVICTNLVLGRVGNKLLDVTMITTYILTTDEPIRASTLFVIVAFCRTLSSSFMRFFPRAVQYSSECLVTVKRIETFLLHQEQSDVSSTSKDDPLSSEVKISLKNMTSSWKKELKSPTLSDISLEVQKNQLIAVIGPVGSGKSSLLMSILNEMPVVSGSCQTTCRFAYVSQQPWVFNGTIQENILFGQPLDRRKLIDVLSVCALERDIQTFSHGEHTIIGERGATLSGGQKSRINLARALYHEADVYLLDDPLSAVDSEVGKHIFKKCIMGYLQHKPRILVTNQLQYLKEADQIIIFKEGSIEAQGTYADLQECKIDFSDFLQNCENEVSLEEVTSMQTVEVKGQVQYNQEATQKISTQKMFQAESKEKGSVGLWLYLSYFKAGTSWIGVIFLAFFLLGAQSLDFCADIWLAVWADHEEISDATNITSYTTFLSKLTSNTSVAIYGGIVALMLLFAMFRSVLCFHIMIHASKNLHGQMFAAVVRAPMSFFDTNPTGRIQNRFTKDIGVLDDKLPVIFFTVIQLTLHILGTILLNAILNYLSLVLVLPSMVVFVFLWRYALCTTQPIKRLDAITRSPVFTHTTNSLHGLIIIRAYRKQNNFIKKFNELQDNHTEAWFMYLVTQRWFASRVDLLLFLFTASITFAAVLAKERLDSGLVGLLLTNTIAITTVFQFCICQMAIVENLMTSTERIKEYTKIPPEAPLTLKGQRPSSNWPGQGSIKVDHLSLTYSGHSAAALRDVTCQIHAGEKIGIVGRTGAGKTSFITSLFRLVEPDGVIIIDGVEIKGIGLHDLRKRLSIIPQDPVLFKGSLRQNLDPFDCYDDSELWEALRDVQLFQVIQDKPQNLDSEVGVDGCNFSVGQKQLLCLARAIIKQNRILILDEATANVDPKTDALIQDTIRSKFKDCTVLTIAHRLNTVIDSDRIMVFDDGELKEFEHPHILLESEGGFFSNLVSQMGSLETKRLKDIARENYMKGRPRPSWGTDQNIEIQTADQICDHDIETEVTNVTESSHFLSDQGMDHQKSTQNDHQNVVSVVNRTKGGKTYNKEYSRL